MDTGSVGNAHGKREANGAGAPSASAEGPPTSSSVGVESQSPSPPRQALPPVWLLRRSDQAVVAGLIVLAVLGMLLWARCQADPEAGLVDIDQAQPLRADFRVDINQATWPELAQLPGIGPALARQIVQYRLSKGPFRCLKDLDKVPGIGPKKLQQIKPYLLPLPEECPQQPAKSP